MAPSGAMGWAMRLPRQHRRHRRQWSRFADGLPALLRCTDAEAACGFVNAAWCTFTGLGTAEALGQGWLAAVHPDDREACRSVLQRAHADGGSFRHEYRLRRADGAWRRVLEQGQPEPMHLLALALDVTETRHALNEREQLVQELQHRVRNNAQVTSSILSLQAGRSSQPAVAAALRGAAARVLLATQVQDRMFHVANNASVDLGQEVAAAALAACDLAGQDRARLELRLAAGIAVPVRQAAPLALIVNELVGNALHHAFPAGGSGQVRVRLRRATPDQAELEVADEGSGLAEPQEAGTGSSGSLGLHLAVRLAVQAGAKLVMEAPSPGGTRLCLRFNAPDESAALAGL